MGSPHDYGTPQLTSMAHAAQEVGLQLLACSEGPEAPLHQWGLGDII